MWEKGRRYRNSTFQPENSRILSAWCSAKGRSPPFSHRVLPCVKSRPEGACLQPGVLLGQSLPDQ